MTLKIAACGQIAVLALVFAGAISGTQAQIVVKSVADPPTQADGSKVAVKRVADPHPQTQRSTIILRSAPNSLLHEQGSTTSVRSVLQPQTLAQSSEGAATAGGPEDQNLIISPGGLQRHELPANMGSVIVGDPNILDVLPTTERVIYLIGKRVGNTDVAILGESGRIVFQANVSVYSLPDPRFSDVSIYNGGKLTNFTSYSCLIGGYCAVSTYNEVRREDLPKGYLNNTCRDTTEQGNGQGGGGGRRPAPTQTIPIAPTP